MIRELRRGGADVSLGDSRTPAAIRVAAQQRSEADLIPDNDPQFAFSIT